MKTDTKKENIISYKLTSTSRAIFVYDQALEIARFYKLKSDQIVRKGNVVTLPSWFPLSPSAN